MTGFAKTRHIANKFNLCNWRLKGIWLKDAARAINRFASEGYDLLGTSDGPALQNFLEDYFCGDDDDLLSGTVSPHNKVC